MKTIKKIAVAAIGISVLLTSAVYAANPAVLGRTYEIREKDALQAIEDAAKKVDWQKVFNEKKMEAFKKYQPKDLRRLPRATEDASYMVDMTYTLDIDVPDGRGGILYPKGYTFNPLEYVKYPGTIVVIDASDEEQVDWFNNSEYARMMQTRLLISDGAHYDAAEAVDRPVFYLREKMADRFKLRAVPSVVKQNGKYMEVQLINVDTAKK